MQRDLTKSLADWLAGGGHRIGQIILSKTPAGWELRHVEDRDHDDLAVYTAPEAARTLANFTSAGAFRPLKTAPTLARGWVLHLPDAAAVHRALDYFYPAMIGCAESLARGVLPTASLRETLGRQTGMYRVTQRISDEDARATIDRFCAGCLKQRLWEIDGPNPRQPSWARDEWPLPCQEACNLLVAEIRKVVKAQQQ